MPTGTFAIAYKVMCGVRASADTYAIWLIPGNLFMSNVGINNYVLQTLGFLLVTFLLAVVGFFFYSR